MRITKVIAEEIAIKLTSKFEEKIQEKTLLLQKTACEIYEKELPKEVLGTFKKFPDYFETRTSFNLVGVGAHSERIPFGKHMPCKTYMFAPPMVEDVTLLLSLINSIKLLEKEKDKLQTNIQETLLSLKTYNRILTEFPEAGKLLPSSNCVSLSIPIDSLREKLNSI